VHALLMIAQVVELAVVQTNRLNQSEHKFYRSLPGIR
jgi:hypothetical protein